jgi:acyl carrier protein
VKLSFKWLVDSIKKEPERTDILLWEFANAYRIGNVTFASGQESTDYRVLLLTRTIEQKWMPISRGERAEVGRGDCYLCKAFYGVLAGNCFACPIYSITREHVCYGTPYGAWSRQFPNGETRFADTEEKVKAAQAMIAFLESVRSSLIASGRVAVDYYLHCVSQIIKDVLGTEMVTLEMKLIKDLGADSLEIAELAMNIEEKFNINVTDDEIKGIVTVGDIVDLVERKTNEKN